MSRRGGSRSKLRFVLVLIVFASLGLLGFVLGQTLLERSVEAPISDFPEMAAGLEQRIRGFHRVNVRDGEMAWDLRATVARIEKGQQRITVEAPRLELFDPGGTKVSVQAQEGRVQLAGGELERIDLTGTVIVDFGDYHIETPEGYYLGVAQTVVLPKGVAVTGGSVDLAGDVMLLNLGKRRVSVLGHVVTKFHAGDSLPEAVADGEG
ncbi:MAG: LPS export ABC transporter periplasmic protein LptC [Deltaproteobacteria bacterium]